MRAHIGDESMEYFRIHNINLYRVILFFIEITILTF